jgi:uncharacterized protein YdeI (YjbR/CyaY-like superfamily)
VDSAAKPRFFTTSAQFRRWLERNHTKEIELWIGYYKKRTGQPSLTWAESVDEALCFGWIDGIRKGIDEISYKVRFTPRRTSSIWSTVNIRNVQRLIETERMMPAGLTAFEARRENRSEIYSYEQRPAELPAPLKAQMRKNRKATDYFDAQPRGYRQQMIWWIISARTEATRLKRLGQLIEFSSEHKRVR